MSSHIILLLSLKFLNLNVNVVYIYFKKENIVQTFKCNFLFIFDAKSKPLFVNLYEFHA